MNYFKHISKISMSKSFLILFFTIIQFTGLSAESNIKILKDKITDVVVYPSQAMVTRSAEIDLEKGLHKLVFDKIPSDYEEGSIQVKGYGNAEIKDIKKVTDFKKEEVDERRKNLLDQIKKFDKDIRITQDDLNLINDEKMVIKNIMKKVTTPTEKVDNSEIDPLKWKKMVEFYKLRKTSLNKKARSTEKTLKELKKEKQKIQDQLNQLGYNDRKSRKQIEVLVDATRSGRIKLILSYLVYDTYWKPKYDIRVSSDNKIMQLIYKSEIKQNTGEDWVDVNLKISTAQPQIGGEHPELDPWRLSIYSFDKRKLHIRGGRSNEVSYSIDGMSVSDPIDGGSQLSIDSDTIAKTKVMPGGFPDEYGASTFDDIGSWSSNLTSSVFEISGKKTILADNQAYSVTISINSFPAEFRYSTVPKLSENAFLKAKVTNTSEYPFLEGLSNIFLDDNFVASGHFDYAAPSEEFWTFLGVDTGIDVEYKFIKKFKEKTGILSKKEKVRFEYEIKIKNNKKTEEDIVIKDQIPISSDKNIKVVLIEPEYIEETKKFKLTKENYLEWNLKIQPGEEKVIPLKFSIEYPKNMDIEGL